MGTDQYTQVTNNTKAILYILGQASHFVSPDGLVSKRMVWDIVQEELLEEAHVLQTKKGYLLLGLASTSASSQDAMR